MRVAALVAIAVAAIVVIAPAVIGREGLTMVGLFPLAVVVLGSGLLLRFRGPPTDRRLGSILLIAGVAGFAILLALTWLVLQGLGRPF
jgi:hypothetical protein